MNPLSLILRGLGLLGRLVGVKPGPDVKPLETKARYYTTPREYADIPPCPPCPQCSHLHRLSDCALCDCDMWRKPGALARYNRLMGDKGWS